MKNFSVFLQLHYLKPYFTIVAIHIPELTLISSSCILLSHLILQYITSLEIYTRGWLIELLELFDIHSLIVQYIAGSTGVSSAQILTDQVPESFKLSVINTARNWPFYFSRIFAVNVSAFTTYVLFVFEAGNPFYSSHKVLPVYLYIIYYKIVLYICI